MDIESKIMLGFLFAFIAGIFIGWYVTWQKYHQEEEKRQAVAAHIAHEKIMTPPMTEREKFFNLIKQLNNIDVNEFRIVYGDEVFVMNPSNKPNLCQHEGEIQERTSPNQMGAAAEDLHESVL
jgi:hypothetical protein